MDHSGIGYMPLVARLGDLGVGICYRHVSPIPMSGMVAGGSGNVVCNGLGVARIGDIVIANCGHVGTIYSGSPDVLANGLPVARLGDGFAGDFVGTIASGSADTAANG